MPARKQRYLRNDGGSTTAGVTPRERLLPVINHRQPDRVLIDLGGGASTTLITEAYRQLRQRPA